MGLSPGRQVTPAIADLAAPRDLLAADLSARQTRDIAALDANQRETHHVAVIDKTQAIERGMPVSSNLRHASKPERNAAPVTGIVFAYTRFNHESGLPRPNMTIDRKNIVAYHGATGA